MSANRPHSEKNVHAHAPSAFGKAFAIAAILNLGFVVVEITYGLIAQSTALLADAAHNTGDVLGLLLAWGAYTAAQRLPTRRYTYGFRSTTILAALLNGMFLLVATGVILWEAMHRILHPMLVEGSVVIVVAAIGILINSFSAFLLSRGNKDLNIRSAFWHLAADAGVSAGVVVTGVIILYTAALWADPLASIIISVAIVWSTWSLLREAVTMSLDAVPSSIDAAEVTKYLEKLDGVVRIHDLHIWSISTSEVALTCHLVMPKGHPDDTFMGKVSDELQHTFGISHATLQSELGTEDDCVLKPSEVV